MRVASEHHFHDGEQLSEYVAEALSIVQAHDLEPPDSSRLLPVLVELLAAKQVQFEQVSPAGILQGIR